MGNDFHGHEKFLFVVMKKFWKRMDLCFHNFMNSLTATEFYT